MQDYVSQALHALRQKNFAAARDCMTSYAEEHALEFQHYLIKGLAESALQEWQAAHDTFSEACGFFPHQSQLWFNLGLSQENLGLLDEAADSYEHALAITPTLAEACGNLSNIYRRRGRLAESEAMAHRAYELGAPRAPSLNSLGLVLAKQGKFDAAENVYKEAQQFDANSASIELNLGNLYVDQLRFAEAWPHFARARQLDPTQSAIRRDEALARLLVGEYISGWDLYESRFAMPGALRIQPSCPRYQAGNLQGKTIMLVAEQGFGDVIQFCRYGQILASFGANLVWVVPQALVRILAANVKGLVIAEGDEVPPCDAYIPMMSLPHTLKLDHPQLAPGTPYIQALSQPLLPNKKANKRAVGVVWAGSSTHERDHERSIPLDFLSPLWRLSDAQFYAPFTGGALDDIGNAPITPLDNLIDDFADTAALIAQMDALITVDTAAAHLAGAMGKKTFLLLPHCPDWRWGTGGTTTSWYSSITILRQPYYGDWHAVVENLMTQMTTLG